MQRLNRITLTHKIAPLILALLFFAFCSRRIYEVAYPALNDKKYDTEFPYQDCSKQLADISRSVFLLSSVAYYRGYLFPEYSYLLSADLNADLIKEKATETFSYNKTASGTATLIAFSERRAALMTCAHVVNFPDRELTYFQSNENDETPRYVRSVAFKTRQSNYINLTTASAELEILVLDEDLDIAFLGQKIHGTDILPVFNYPLGRAKKLEWGCFIYLIGFPRGYKMITKGIVSSPNLKSDGAFLTDAAFNRGFSGGLAVAIKDGVPNFELVGITKSAAADYEYILTPPGNYDDSRYDPNYPYEDEIYLKLIPRIQYGVTNVIPIELIENFWKAHEDELLDKGYDLSRFFNRDK